MGNGKTNHRERRGHREISRSAQIKLTGEGRHLSFVICHWSLVIGQSSIVNCHWSFVISFSPPLPLVPLVPRVQEQLDIVLSAVFLPLSLSPSLPLSPLSPLSPVSKSNWILFYPPSAFCLLPSSIGVPHSLAWEYAGSITRPRLSKRSPFNKAGVIVT